MSKLQASTKVAGTYYYEAKSLHKSKKLTRGTGITIRRDSANAYDKNAIKVLHGSGKLLGFIPKEFASSLALLMDKGLRASASVKESGIRDGKLYLSLNLSYTNIPRTRPPPKPTPKATPVRPRPISKPSRSPVMPQQSTRPKTMNNPRPHPTVSQSSQIKNEGKSGFWWVGTLVVAVILLLLLGSRLIRSTI